MMTTTFMIDQVNSIARIPKYLWLQLWCRLFFSYHGWGHGQCGYTYMIAPPQQYGITEHVCVIDDDGDGDDDDDDEEEEEEEEEDADNDNDKGVGG